MKNLTEKQESLLVLLYLEGYPHPTRDGYFFSNNVRCDMRTFRALEKRGLAGMCRGSYFGAGRGIASRLMLTEAGELIAEDIDRATERRWRG